MVIRFIFASLFLCFTSVQAFACSCIPMESKPVSEQINGDTIFAGKAISSRYENHDNPFGHVITTFEVGKSFRGQDSQIIEVKHSENDASCGIRFEIGEPQLIRAYETDNGLLTGLCANRLPKMMTINFFEKQENVTPMEYYTCIGERHIARGGPDGDYQLSPGAPETCRLYTKDGYAEYEKDWQVWLEKEGLKAP